MDIVTHSKLWPINDLNLTRSFMGTDLKLYCRSNQIGLMQFTPPKIKKLFVQKVDGTFGNSRINMVNWSNFRNHRKRFMLVFEVKTVLCRKKSNRHTFDALCFFSEIHFVLLKFNHVIFLKFIYGLFYSTLILFVLTENNESMY